MPELTDQQRAERRTQALAAIEKGLRETHHIWHQTPSRLDWAAGYALDALGDLAWWLEEAGHSLPDGDGG
ncbi:hypothetical protein OEIGOIKO_05813 [Streptomyces chrestomyceticus JCM 4735]|uniref:Uncharacterized protein n=1 Tax=Streptomyces chrestomyceticus JCM 4735 TaxID=1306181 RepID=A0A7U9Q005_9ACTN|nr:hypothetical protein [Streptomyces chrestomyceticus]GCD38003.1 hypothetical protein OEIGOIKO_05813 [Streptomyces chrestomyceticus JCM 4735]